MYLLLQLHYIPWIPRKSIYIYISYPIHDGDSKHPIIFNGSFVEHDPFLAFPIDPRFHSPRLIQWFQLLAHTNPATIGGLEDHLPTFCRPKNMGASMVYIGLYHLKYLTTLIFINDHHLISFDHELCHIIIYMIIISFKHIPFVNMKSPWNSPWNPRRGLWVF